MLLLSMLALPALAPMQRAWDRRQLLGATVAATSLGLSPANAFVAGADEEVSGLVVLRVAEVCTFQENLLRTLAACNNGSPTKEQLSAKDQFGNLYCDAETYSVNPAQISFGTGLMLRNANLDGNLKLMISTEVARKDRQNAIKDAVSIMNTFNKLANTASTYATFEGADLLRIADIYAEARQKLARFFDYLPAEAQSRFYNYAEVRHACHARRAGIGALHVHRHRPLSCAPCAHTHGTHTVTLRFVHPCADAGRAQVRGESIKGRWH